MDFINEYKDFLVNHGLHETFTLDFINKEARKKGFRPYFWGDIVQKGDKIIYTKDKLIALVEVGEWSGTNLIVSHIDSPRLDVIPNDPIEVNQDGVFFKVVPYGGIIPQLWFDRPLVLVGNAFDSDGNLIKVNSKDENKFFSMTSLLPHLKGRQEIQNMTYDKLKIRVSNNEDEFKAFGLTKDDLKLANLSFVPYVEPMDMGLDGDLMSGYGHDDSCCAWAELQAFFDSESEFTKIALFTSYEETGSAQLSGADSQFIDDIFLTLANGDMMKSRHMMLNTNVISADVCAGYDSNFSNHFESGARAVCGKGTAIVPFLGLKRGNDSNIFLRKIIKDLCDENEIDYQIESTKATEGGGGTVSTFFARRGMYAIDIGVPVLAMHSPLEQISKHDLEEIYKLYKAFYESDK